MGSAVQQNAHVARVDERSHHTTSGWWALLATAFVVVLPTVTVTTVFRVTGTTPNIFFTWAVTAGLSTCLLVLATGWWMRQPGSTSMSFGELMLWRWVKRRKADERLKQEAKALSKQAEIETTRYGQLQVLRDLNAALETRDPYTRGHARRVERHAYRTALAMHLGVDDIFDLRLAASLHDIGKIRVPIEIIRKQGPLDDHEWAVMKQHSAIGAGIIANIGNDSLVESVRHHHERWDGSGYPDGISGREIPLHARIIAVSDAFDAITSNRSYRGKSNRKKAIEILKAQSGKQFDPEVVEAFLSALPRSLPGIAALSSLGFPAMRRVASEFSVIVRQAGAFGVAGAIATSGVTGVVATTVHPSKYLNGPAAVDNARSAATGERKDHSPSSAPGLVLGEILARPEDGPPATAGDGDRSARGTGRDAARTQRKRSRGKARSGGKARERATGKKTASGQNKGEEEKVAHAAPGKAKKAAKEAAAAATSATEASKPNPSKHDEGGDPDKTAADTVDEPAPAKGKPDKTEPTDVDGTVGNVEDEASEHGKGSGKDK